MLPPAVIDAVLAGESLPHPARDAHKYQRGTVLVLAGSRRYAGAAELVCRAAYRSGAGLVTLAGSSRFPGSWPEIIHEQLDWSAGPLQLQPDLKRTGILVAGPGLDSQAVALLPAVLELLPVPCVLDASALQRDERLQQVVARKRSCVLTPHAGEAARLLDVSARRVTADPLAAARLLARQWQAIIVLKGFRTHVVAPDGSALLSVRGHPGMATAGTGDVLAGVIGAVLAGVLAGAAPHSLPRLASVAAAVFVHGLAGELAAAEADLGMIASDIVSQLPAAFSSVRRAAAGA